MNLAIITGTTRGLGRSMSRCFQEIGWHVEVLNRPRFDLCKLNIEIVEQAFSQMSDAHDVHRVVFVNNAATHNIAAAKSLQHSTIQREITVNVTSPIALISAFLRHFPGGEVANVTSVAAIEPYPFWSLYCAAKAALEGYIRSVAAEGTKVHTLNPGAIDTDMQRAIRSADFPGVERFSGIKLKSPDVIAKSLVWLIDRAA